MLWRALMSGDIRSAFITLALSLPAIVLCLSIHETAHGGAAYLLGDRTARDSGRVTWSLSQFLLIVASMSVGLGVFNLVPVHPLDGSRVVDAFMPFSWSLKLQKYQNIIFFVFIAALWFGWLDGIMDWVGNGVLMLAVNFVSLFL